MQCNKQMWSTRPICYVTTSKQVLSMFKGSKIETIGKSRIPLTNPKLNEEYKNQQRMYSTFRVQNSSANEAS